MLQGRNFVAHVVWSTIAEGALTVLSQDFRATVTRISDGVYEVALTDDCAVADAVPIVKITPVANSDVGHFVGWGWLRTAAQTFRIFTYPAVLLSAGGGTGFAALQTSPADGTIISFSLDRVDTV